MKSVYVLTCPFCKNLSEEKDRVYLCAKCDHLVTGELN